MKKRIFQARWTPAVSHELIVVHIDSSISFIFTLSMYYDKTIILQIIYIVNIFNGNIFHIPVSLRLSANNLLSAGAVQCLDGQAA